MLCECSITLIKGSLDACNSAHEIQMRPARCGAARARARSMQRGRAHAHSVMSTALERSLVGQLGAPHNYCCRDGRLGLPLARA